MSYKLFSYNKASFEHNPSNIITNQIPSALSSLPQLSSTRTNLATEHYARPGNLAIERQRQKNNLLYATPDLHPSSVFTRLLEKSRRYLELPRPRVIPRPRNVPERNSEDAVFAPIQKGTPKKISIIHLERRIEFLTGKSGIAQQINTHLPNQPTPYALELSLWRRQMVETRKVYRGLYFHKLQQVTSAERIEQKERNRLDRDERKNRQEKFKEELILDKKRRAILADASAINHRVDSQLRWKRHREKNALFLKKFKNRATTSYIDRKWIDEKKLNSIKLSDQVKYSPTEFPKLYNPGSKESSDRGGTLFVASRNLEGPNSEYDERINSDLFHPRPYYTPELQRSINNDLFSKEKESTHKFYKISRYDRMTMKHIQKFRLRNLYGEVYEKSLSVLPESAPEFDNKMVRSSMDSDNLVDSKIDPLGNFESSVLDPADVANLYYSNFTNIEKLEVVEEKIDVIEKKLEKLDQIDIIDQSSATEETKKDRELLVMILDNLYASKLAFEERKNKAQLKKELEEEDEKKKRLVRNTVDEADD